MSRAEHMLGYLGAEKWVWVFDKYPLDKILWRLKPDVYPIVELRAMISSIFDVDEQEAIMLLQAIIGLKW